MASASLKSRDRKFKSVVSSDEKCVHKLSKKEEEKKRAKSIYRFELYIVI